MTVSLTTAMMWMFIAMGFGWLLGRGYGPMMGRAATAPLRFIRR